MIVIFLTVNNREYHIDKVVASTACLVEGKNAFPKDFGFDQPGVSM